MDKPIRLTHQKRQERKSWHQFRERLEDFGWIASRPSEDLGEDFIVHIYFQGKATGVTFHVQLKSITNLNKRHNGDYLVFDEIKVKDLKHWEDFKFPVVLVVWDVNLREGRWALVEDIIKDLDKWRPKWRGNKSKVRVRIPWGNTTNDSGLVWLKQRIGHSVYPLISKDKELEIGMRLSFPNSEEGRAAFVAFERAVKEGEPATTKGKFIEGLKFSDWLTPWVGEFEVTKVEFSSGLPTSPQAYPVHIDFISTYGEPISISNIELKIIKAGTEIIQWSNEHQDSSLHFYVTIPRSKDKDGKISIKLNNLGRNVHETRDTLRFLGIVTSGGKLQLSLPTFDNASLTIPIPPTPEKAPDSRFLKLIDKLCTIQNRVGQFIQVPVEGITHQDAEAINKFAEIIEYGKTTTLHKGMTSKFEGEALDLIMDAQRKGEPIQFRLSYAGSYTEFLGLKILTGPMTHWVTGKPNMPILELDKTTTKFQHDDHLDVEFVDIEVVDIHPDWYIREAERLSRLLIENFEVKAVYLFGSLVWSDIHAPETDIDLAVSGLPPEKLLEVVGYLERESKFSIDLVELEKLPDHLRQRILSEGKLLCEREPAMALG